MAASTQDEGRIRAATGLPADAARRLIAVSRPFAHSQGSILFREGDASDGLYILTDGRASVRTRVPGDDELSVTTLGPGQLLGEMGLLDGARRSATASADTNIEGLFVSRARFGALAYDPSPGSLDVIDLVRAQIASRLRQTYSAIAETASFDPASLRHAANGLAPQPLPEGDAPTLLSSLIRFAPLCAADRERLSATGQVMTAERGATLARPGTQTDRLWLVLRGAVRVGVPRPGGHEQIAVHGPGEFAGMVSMLDATPHPVGMACCEASILLAFDRRAFAQWHDERSDAGDLLLDLVNRQLARDLRRANRHLGRNRGLVRFNRREQG